jgi:RNA polymerase sigma-70 factor (ECF subfamily)
MLAQQKVRSADNMGNIIKLTPSGQPDTSLARAEETRLLIDVRDNASTESFDKFFVIFTPKLVAWVTSRGCAMGEAESVVQDVMVAAWSRAKSFDSAKASARTWIYTLARNRMIDLYRSGTRRAAAHEEAGTLAETMQPVQDEPQKDLARDQVIDAVETLPAEQRDVIFKVYFEGRSHREIAEDLALPLGTVKSRARLGFQKLRKSFKDSI